VFQIDEVNYNVIFEDLANDGRGAFQYVFGMDKTAENWTAFLRLPTREIESSEGAASLTGIDGGVMTSVYAGPQQIVWDVDVIETDTLTREEAVESIMDLNIGLKRDLRIEWTEKGTGLTKIIENARLTKYITPIPSGDDITKSFQISFMAPDPFIYGADEFHNGNADGDPPDLEEDIEEGTPTSWDGANAGNAPTWPRFYVYGPFTALSISDVNSAHQIAINAGDYTWAENDFLYIDTDPRTRSVLLNGVHNRYGWLDLDNTDFFPIFPGAEQTITAAATDTDVASKIICRWRSAWY